MKKESSIIFLLLFFVLSSLAQNDADWKLRISDDKRYFVKANGEPFFWLGDTGWLLFGKLTREEADRYLQDRKEKGFNVIQAMVLHGLDVKNAYGQPALIDKNVATPNANSTSSHNYWKHIDYIIQLAAQKGLYMALVPVWGSNVKAGGVKLNDAKIYAKWLAERYRNYPNIIWLNGGDIRGSDSMNTWKAIGNIINETDTNHLITFHPFGRTTSSQWFHNEPWLDFNMFQSGHRSYDLDTSKSEHRFGPDNYKFVIMDYKKLPAKPTLDGEPSYEDIPYGLHDTTKPRWNADDVRRYAYWEVFAGGAGYTYGHNSVMQMHQPRDTGSSFGSRYMWYDAINHDGAKQMIHLYNLMMSMPYLERVPDQSMIAGVNGSRYNYIAAMRGKEYAFFYIFNGRDFSVNLGKIKGAKIHASWFDPKKGVKTPLGTFVNKGTRKFDPPGNTKNGNDWVLILETI